MLQQYNNNNHAYNSTRNDTTMMTPYYLMFGREPKLPVDIMFDTTSSENSKEPTTKYIKELKDRMKKAYEIASKVTKNAQQKQKELYDLKKRGSTVQKGDTVLVKIVAWDGKHKLSDRWEDEPYDVIDQPNTDVPVFVVKRQDGIGRTRTLHRNLLLPIGHLPKETADEMENQDEETEDDDGSIQVIPKHSTEDGGTSFAPEETLSVDEESDVGNTSSDLSSVQEEPEYLKSLAISGMFPSAEEDIGKALLKIVTEKM